VVDARVTDDALAGGVVHVERLDEIGRPARGGERAREVVAAQGAPRRVLHDHGVAGENRGDDGVHRREERVVPRREIEHDAQRRLHDAALEAVLGRERDVLEGGLGDRHHVPRATGHPRHLAPGLAQRLAHHARDVRGDGVDVFLHPRRGALADRDALGDRAGAEGAGGGLCAVESRGDDRLVREREAAGDVAGERVVDGEGCAHGEGR
jgi:hypothetical protein